MIRDVLLHVLLIAPSFPRNRPPEVDYRKVLEEIAGRKSSIVNVFADFCRMAACAVALQTREDEYLEVAARYQKAELAQMSRALGCLIQEMESSPFTDCLGTFYTQIASKSTVDARGEFYTPPEICELMARMSLNVDTVIEEAKPIQIGDPCCGSGGMVLKLAKLFSPESRGGEKSYVDLLRVTMQDVSPTATDMAYLNTTMWGIPAKIILGDTLRMTTEKIWRNVHWARVGETENERWRAMQSIIAGQTPHEKPKSFKNDEMTCSQSEDFTQMDFSF